MFANHPKLRIDPDNQAAAKGIAQLVARGAASVQLSQPQAPPPTDAPPFTAPAATQRASAPAPRGAPRSAAQRPQSDQVVFSVKPSLAPTLIIGGIAFLLSALLVWVLFSTLSELMSGPGENSASGISFCLSAVVLVMLLYRVPLSLLRMLFTSYTLTSRHLVVESGMLSKHHKTIPIQRIQDVAYRQNILERLLGIGDVIVESAGE